MFPYTREQCSSLAIAAKTFLKLSGDAELKIAASSSGRRWLAAEFMEVTLITPRVDAPSLRHLTPLLQAPDDSDSTSGVLPARILSFLFMQSSEEEVSVTQITLPTW